MAVQKNLQIVLADPDHTHDAMGLQQLVIDPASNRAGANSDMLGHLGDRKVPGEFVAVLARTVSDVEATPAGIVSVVVMVTALLEMALIVALSPVRLLPVSGEEPCSLNVVWLTTETPGVAELVCVVSATTE